MSIERLKAALADRYRVDRELGAGGMATVYLAHDIKHEREVAIKVLREDLAAALGSTRFLREIRIAAKLQHPHILPLLESGEADGFLYYVMPFVKGESLRQRLDRGGELPVSEAVRLTIEVVDALTLAHEHGVVHRDIKPDNVMLSGRHALVMDFGVAKAISEATGRNTVTTLGVAVGTPAYMSPEQAAADPHIDHRSDIYTIGVMLYEMLTGRPPFTGTTPQQVLASHVTEAPDPVSKRRPAIPAALEAVVMRCLAKRPADRFQTAEELQAQLEPLVTPSMGLTPTATTPTVAIRSRRRRGVALIVGVALLAAVAGYVALHRRKPALVVSAPTQLTFTGRVRDVYVSPDGAYVEYGEQTDCGSASTCSGKLDQIVQETSPRGTRRVIDSSGAGFLAGWSPDGRRFLQGTVEGGRQRRSVVTVLGGEVVHSLNGRVAWTASPDTILVWDWTASPAGTTWVRMADASTGLASDSFSFGGNRFINEIRAAPNGRWLLIEYQGRDAFDPRVFVVTDRKGTVLDTVPRHDGAIKWGPKSDRIYLQGHEGSQGLVWKQPINRNGRRSGDARIVARVPSGQFSVGGNVLAYVESGVSQYELWSLEWLNGPANKPSVHSLFRTTTPMWASIDYTGDSIYVGEERISGDSVTWSAWTTPFGGGTRVPDVESAKPPMDADWDENYDAHITADWKDGRTVFTLFHDKSSKAGRELPITFPDSGWVFLLPHQRFVWLSRKGQEFVVLDSLGKVEKRLPWPDSLGMSGFMKTSDGLGLAVVTQQQVGDSSKIALYRVAFADGNISLIAGPFQREGGFLRWAGRASSDGWLPVMQIRGGGQNRLFWVSMNDGRIVDRGPAPVPGEVSDFWYSRDRRRATAVTVNIRADIMLIRNFDPDGS